MSKFNIPDENFEPEDYYLSENGKEYVSGTSRDMDGNEKEKTFSRDADDSDSNWVDEDSDSPSSDDE